MPFTIDPGLLGLEDQVALVVGGGGPGIGRATAVQLARAGCHIAIADISDEFAGENVKMIEALGRRAIFIKANVRDGRQVKRMVAEAVGAFGRLDVAVNVVGGGMGPTCFLDITEEQWDGVMEMNLKTTFLCCQAEALAMIERDTPGRIINVGSSAGVSGAATLSAYGASKAGVIHLTKSIALELAPYNIRVNCLIPGPHVPHEGQRRSMNAPGSPPEFKKYMETRGSLTPMGRAGGQMETAGLAVFFASKLSSYVTGHSLLSDGGITHTTARPPAGLDMKAKILKAMGKA